MTAPGFALSRTYNPYGEIDVADYGSYRYDVTRDAAGRIVTKTEETSTTVHTWAYAYDELGRLATARLDGELLGGHQTPHAHMRSVARHSGRGRAVEGTIESEVHMITLVQDKREAIVELCRRHGVVRMDVFGSALRDDFHPGESDVDLLVEFSDREPYALALAYFDLLDELKVLLGTEVDLVMAGAVKNRYVRAEIENTRQLLYAA